MATAQENSKRLEYKHFKIFVQVIGDSVKLSCMDGCAWKELSFYSKYNLQAQAINQYGLTRTNNLNLLNKDEMLADFMISIQRNSTELVIKGIEGMQWESLIIPCTENGCQRFIDEKNTEKIIFLKE